MISDFLKGMTSYLEAFAKIRALGLSKYYLYSGLIGIIVLLFLYFLWYSSWQIVNTYVGNYLNFDSRVINGLIDTVTGAGLVIFFLTIYKYLVIIATSPLMSKLSEDVESKLDEDFFSTSFSFSKILKDLLRSLRLSIRNVVRELFYSLCLLIVGLLPIVTIATTPLILIVQGYYAGFGNMDYYLERYYGTKETISFVKRHKPLAAGNGLVFIFLLAIPVLGVFIAPVLGTVAATLETHRRIHDFQNY